MRLLILGLMAAAALLIPLGLPGLWVMLVGSALLAGLGWLSWGVWAGLAVLVVLVELLEFAVMGRFARRYGGSTRAFWGAALGGLVGLFVGLPVPVIGSVLTAILGSLLGAAIVTFYEARSLGRAGRVAWGVLLARFVSIGLKGAAAVAVLGISLLASRS